MKKNVKYEKILDALQELLEKESLQNISVSEIAQTAGIAKGSIYYYFPSKEAILEALVERNYKTPLETAQTLAEQTDISPFTRMAMIFQACRNSSAAFLSQKQLSSQLNAPEEAFLRQKYMTYLVSSLKPVLTEIIQQGIAHGDLRFDHPAALAEIALIILVVKLDNSLFPCSPGETEDTIVGLISLLEKGTGNPSGSLNFLTSYTQSSDRAV